MAHLRRARSATAVALLALVSGVIPAVPAQAAITVTMRPIQVTSTSFTVSCNVDPGGGTAYLQYESRQTGHSGTTRQRLPKRPEALTGTGTRVWSHTRTGLLPGTEYEARCIETDGAGSANDILPPYQTFRTARFPGDPGDGVILSGSSIRTADPSIPDVADWLDAHTSGTKTHYLARLYGTTRGPDLIDWTRIDQQLAKGRLPVVSTRYSTWTPAQIAAGAADAQLAGDANNFKARAPQVIWFDYFHEPYDNFPCCTSSAQFRAAYRHIVNYFEAAGVTNVAYYGPVSMVSWEYTPAGVTQRGGEAYEEDPDWKGTKSCTVSGVPTPCATDWYTGAQAVVDILAFDQYSPGSVGGAYKSFSTAYNAYKTKMNLWQRPWKPQIVPEIGTRDAAGADWNAHWADVKSTMLANHIIGYAYFNHGPNSSFYSADPTGARLAAYNTFFNDPVVVGAP